MRYNTKIFFLVIILDLLNPAVGSFAQTPQENLEFARGLISARNYEEGIVELERVMFFSDSLDKVCHILLSEAFFCNTMLQESSDHLARAIAMETDDSAKTGLIFLMATRCLSLSDPATAIVYLNEINPQSSSSFQQKKMFFLSAAYFLMDQYAESERYYRLFLQYINAEETLEIRSIFNEANKNQRKRWGIYAISSAFLPGLGQVLCGEPLDGLNSFLLTGSLVAVAILSMNHLLIFDAAVTFLPWILRYYTGGITNTKVIAEQKKSLRKAELYNKLIRCTGDLVPVHSS